MALETFCVSTWTDWPAGGGQMGVGPPRLETVICSFLDTGISPRSYWGSYQGIIIGELGAFCLTRKIPPALWATGGTSVLNPTTPLPSGEGFTPPLPLPGKPIQALNCHDDSVAC